MRWPRQSLERYHGMTHGVIHTLGLLHDDEIFGWGLERVCGCQHLLERIRKGPTGEGRLGAVEAIACQV